jgi:hypothetical protein
MTDDTAPVSGPFAWPSAQLRMAQALRQAHDRAMLDEEAIADARGHLAAASDEH